MIENRPQSITLPKRMTNSIFLLESEICNLHDAINIIWNRNKNIILFL